MARSILRSLFWWLDNHIVGADDAANTDEIHGHEGNDTLIGQGGDDVLFGGPGDDILDGGEGADILSGGYGFDFLLGGPGNDRLFSLSTAEAVAGSDQSPMGEPVLNFSIAAVGEAALDSGGAMAGGTGSDTFFVDLAFFNSLFVDGGISLAGDTDTINFGSQANVWVNGVPANVLTNLLDLESGIGETPFGGILSVGQVENITGGEYRDEFYGDDGANTLLGMANNDVLEGRGGGDTLDGGNGFDVAQYTSSPLGVDVDLLRTTQLLGDAANDRLFSIEEVRGSDFGDLLRGTNATNIAEVFAGDDGDDTLEGRGGADTLNGGPGFDFASYESSRSAVNVLLQRPGFIPAQTGGHAEGDTLVSIEGLIGSAFDDTLIGNDERNELRGGDGADTLSGLGGTDTLRGGIGADQLYGGTQNDALDGGFGNDTLDGGGDIDTADFSSWTGYTIAQSIRIELGLNGADGIAERTSLSVLETDTLRSIENVQGSNWAETIKGNELSNNLHGGGGADRLEGGGQNDVLNGGLGLDTLIGGTGFDVFKFDTALGAGNVDSILDYNVADDQISLDDSVFRALANPGFDDSNLSTSAFAVGTAALDASDRIIYNSTSGALLYDSDGTGSAAAVQFATLMPLLNLTAADFVIV